MSQVTLGSFSAPPVPGELKGVLRLTWHTLAPLTQPEIGPGRESHFCHGTVKSGNSASRRPKPAASDTGGALTIYNSSTAARVMH